MLTGLDKVKMCTKDQEGLAEWHEDILGFSKTHLATDPASLDHSAFRAQISCRSTGRTRWAIIFTLIFGKAAKLVFV